MSLTGPKTYILRATHKRYKTTIYVLENGLADCNTDDVKRQNFLVDHIDQVWLAKNDGVDIRGYIHWSLTDNFEWAEGFSARFGLIKIDYENNFRREPRVSAGIYSNIIEENAVSSELFEKYAKKIKNVKFLAQGTLYPDLIESKSVTGSQTSKIKSHHNVGGLPKRMKLKLVEPLKYLFKDEVRMLGLELNLSKEIISRHPFPGPGLAIRMPGIITKEKIKILKEADNYFVNALREHNLYHKIWQAYAALLPVKTVGVMGDNRTYEYLCLLRAITSEDGMTADYFQFNKSFMQMVSNKIVNNIRGINRVVYDVTSKPPSTIEPVSYTHLTLPTKA